jgi:UDP-N-acetylglucosamine acyltransferase
MIHPTAIINPKARLGVNISIAPYAFIDENTEIGDNSSIGPFSVILKYTQIKANCNIHSHAVIGDLPQDLTFKEAPSYVHIGGGTTIREGVTIHRGTKPETITEIGENCYLMVNSHIAHNVKVGNNVIMANGALLAGYVEVGERAFISGNVIIHQFVRIGRLAMLSGASAISQDVPPFCTTRGISGNIVAGLNTIGMRRAGIPQKERTALRRAFHILYFSGLKQKDAIKKILEQETSPLVKELCLFISQTKRGICTPKQLKTSLNESEENASESDGNET